MTGLSNNYKKTGRFTLTSSKKGFSRNEVSLLNPRLLRRTVALIGHITWFRNNLAGKVRTLGSPKRGLLY